MSSRNLAFRAVLILSSLATLSPSPVLTAPRILEEKVKLQVPGPADQRVVRVALSGNTLLAVGRRDFANETGAVTQQFVYLFERGSSTAPWTFVRVLFDTGVTFTDHSPTTAVAVQGNLAVVHDLSLMIYERGGSGWTQVARLNPPGVTSLTRLDPEIDAGTILVNGAQCSWQTFLNPFGIWERFGNHPLDIRCTFAGFDLDISGNRIVLGDPFAGPNGGAQYTSNVQVFEGVTTTTPTVTFTSPTQPDEEFGSPIAVEGNTIIAGDSPAIGLHAFARDGAGAWHPSASLAPADTMMLGRPSTLDMRGNLIAAAYPEDRYRAIFAGAIAVYRRNNDGTFREIARLVASDGAFVQNLGNQAQIDGRTVAAAANDGVYIFDLPTDLTQPAPIHDNFNSGNAANWTPQAGSSFSVVTSGPSRVYRQSSLAGNATSLRTNLDWRDQSILVDVRPTAFDGPDRWFGLAVRYLDAGNYYYVTLRSSNVIQLKKIVNGTFETLATRSLPVAIGRNYRLSLEAVGTRIRAHVDGHLAVEANDSSLTHGSAGPIMYKARADYDNATLSPSPLLALMTDNFDDSALQRLWTKVAGEWVVTFEPSTDSNVFQQQSLAGGARAVTGVNTRDQTVQVEARPTAFGDGPGRWFGVMARYVDDGNYYYVTARNDNTLSLRKLVNGNIVVLRTVALPVSVGPIYRLRLEAIGSSLRVYVDDELKIEMTDTSFGTGRYGLAMYKAAVQYDDFLATQQ